MICVLSARFASTLHDTLLRVKEVWDKEHVSLEDCFRYRPRLILTPNDNCSQGCLHCISDSKPSGTTLPFQDIARVDPALWRLFATADFGRRGNPLEYTSDGHSITDVINVLLEAGISEFTVAGSVFPRPRRVVERLADYSMHGVPIDSMITYHHYLPGFDPERFAPVMNAALKDYLSFSRSVKIALLGDRLPDLSPTMASRVHDAFYATLDAMLAGIPIIDKKERDIRVVWNLMPRYIHITNVDSRLYPHGRVISYMEERGGACNPSQGDYTCPDLIKWPGMIVEPDGSINMCGSFEGVACPHAVVSNIHKPYGEVEGDLLEFHRRELSWFLENLPAIMDGKVSTCKLRNHCYQ